jgi:predicted metal-binding protein
MTHVPLLSVCLTCRDNREEIYGDRGGTRLARKVHQELGNNNLVKLRGVECMSNCKRACILSLTSLNGFTYMFGDIDPNRSEYVKSLKDLISTYKSRSAGFLRRRERPESYRSNILGRLPPINSKHLIVKKLERE